MRYVQLLLLPLVTLSGTQAVQAAPAATQVSAPARIAYPATARQDVVEKQFGVDVADPYRWLEGDVRVDQKVRDWVTAQNRVTSAYLETLPGRDIFAKRMKALYDYERFGVPVKKGGRYFYTRNDGLQNQSVLFVRDQLGGEGRMLLDPNGWSKDGATALASWAPSEDGRYIAYAIQDGGSDWRTVKVLDTRTGQDTGDTLEWIKNSGVDWAKDGSGFFYSRFPAVPEDQKFQSVNENSKIYFHKLGTLQSADRLVYETPEHPRRGHWPQVSDDGKWLVVTTSEGTDDRYAINLIDLTKPGAKPRTLIDKLENNWSYVGNQGTKFFWATNKDAPKLRVVTLDVAQANPQPVEIIAEDAATLDGVSIVGNTLIASYMVDAKTEVRRYTLDGKPKGTIALPGIGSAGGFNGKAGDPETFFSFTSFATPTAIYRYDAATGQATPWAQPKVAFDPAAYEVSQRFYTSKDGTKVPMFLVRKKGLTGPAPTLLYAYGGFNVPMLPGFSPTRLAWIDQGGVLAVANIRGGGEYGKAWHDAGRLQNKQNVFDDFIAAGEDLIAQGVTTKDKLAIQGGSNGGLLVGAVVNQRPDLFAAALPAVGVMDMLRFDRWTAGRYWVDDYGYPSEEADFKTLVRYSPYHNIKSGADYPAVLVTTADTDDRVVPGHSFKYTAALQAARAGDKPHLIRIETRAGHGSGKPTDKIIEEYADMWAFIAHHTGMTVAD
ncbi:prolyl oligopeptidase family serine peptidase [Sphingomonas sp. LY54]|uniref:prolyl oligopeptidase family serine peptidase n=1 Tax=Sphingomonas sp. LY54 TaxID=3095343 RepID=UPI002D768F9A|nr:prolyl oligopeptidase family serine peptidase [Sphingomonas sp. LY54]WRP28263.1 prolyl oligopeptidase family serine peptidase [Sphingomonas sp. LY54]